MSAQPLTLSRLLDDWTVDPLLLCVLCFAGALYGWGAIRCRTRWPAQRTTSFMAGLFVVALALLSGIDRYADELLSMHVLEHLLLILVAPVLLLWGAPVRLALSASPPAGRRAIAALLRSRTVHVLTRPACGFALFTVVVLGTHLTGAYEAALRNQTIHACEHAAYFWSGLLFLAPLLAVDPIPHPPGAIARFSWLMAAMVVMALPAGVFLFDGHVHYPFYVAPARALHTSALADQRTAGVLMLVGGGVVMGVLAIVTAMGAMLAEERRQKRRDSYADQRTVSAARRPRHARPCERAGGSMRRLLTVVAAVVCGALALVDFASRWDASATPSVLSTPPPSALSAQGHALFDSSCASCHGLGAQGVRGRAPSLHGVGALAADFYLQTGRMPLPSPRAQPLRTSPAFSQSKIKALVAYVASFGGPGIPTVAPRRGSLAEGQRLFGLDCAGCHSIQGQGGIVTGAIVPSLNEATPTQIGEAVRIGPYVMPRFGAGELSSAQVNSLARYIQSIQHPDNLGGWGIGRIGPIPEGMVAWLLAAAALLLIARLLGERTGDGPQGPRQVGSA